MGKLRYGDDGMLYIGRKKHGPYMVCKRYGGGELVVRHAESENIHRMEQHRWNLLLHQQHLGEQRAATIKRMKEIAVRKKIVGFYANQWHQLHFKDDSIERKPIQVDESNILDAMVALGQSMEDHQLVAKYLLLQDLLDKYWTALSRVEGVLQGMFVALNPNRGMLYRHERTSVTVNGRTYITSCGHYPPDDPNRGWPSPMIKHIDLDVARYGPPISMTPQ